MDENELFDFGVTELKKAINNLLWMNLPAEITLGRAEVIACDILTSALDAINRARALLPNKEDG